MAATVGPGVATGGECRAGICVRLCRSLEGSCLPGDRVPLEYSTEWLTCPIASRPVAVMVGWPDAAQDRLLADVPGPWPPVREPSRGSKPTSPTHKPRCRPSSSSRLTINVCKGGITEAVAGPPLFRQHSSRHEAHGQRLFQRRWDGAMASKYDLYWQGRLEEIRAAIQLAAAGAPAAVDVQGLRRLGARLSWYGTVEVRGRTAAEAYMAHAVSLGRTVAASGICTPWQERTFRFIITRAAVLTIAVTDSAVPPHTGALQTQRSARSATNPSARSKALIATTDGDRLDAATGCARIHAALTALPHWTRPDAVPFTNGLYFFYEQGEWSRHAPGGRIVRIGNHPHAQDRLAGRLGDHYNSRPSQPSPIARRFLVAAGIFTRGKRGVWACQALVPLSPGRALRHFEHQPLAPKIPCHCAATSRPPGRRSSCLTSDVAVRHPWHSTAHAF